MKLHSLAIAVLMVSAGSLAQADSIAGNGYTLDFTGGILGSPSWWDVGADGRRVEWKVPPFSISGEMISYSLPDYTLTANAGYTLSAISLFVGNLSFFESAGAASGAYISADLWADGWSGPLVLAATRTVLSPPGSSVVTGYYSFTLPPVGMDLHQVQVTNLKMVMAAEATAAIVGQAQAVVDLDFTVTAVPEPQTYAMLLSGVAVIGWVVRRRRRY